MPLRHLVLVSMPLLFLAGCLEIPVESLCAKFNWDPTEKTVRLDMVAQNVGAGYFDCEGSTEACAESIVAAIKTQNALDLDLEGCIESEERLEQRGDALDIRRICLLPQDSPTLIDLGLQIEREGRPGKEKSHLVIQEYHDITWLDLPKSTKKRVFKVLDNDQEVEEKVTYSLKSNVRSVSGIAQIDDTVTPIFKQKSGLAKRLQDQGVSTTP